MDKVLIYIALTLVVTSSAAPRGDAAAIEAGSNDDVEANKLRNDDTEARLSDLSNELIEQLSQLSQSKRREIRRLLRLIIEAFISKDSILTGRAAVTAGSDKLEKQLKQLRRLSQRKPKLAGIVAVAVAGIITAVAASPDRAADIAGETATQTLADGGDSARDAKQN